METSPDISASDPWINEKQQAHRQARLAHWDAMARRSKGGIEPSGYYHHRLLEIYRFLIPPGHRVLELGSGTGDLLAGLKPSVGVGIDFSPAMVEQARSRHPNLQFHQADVIELPPNEKFDFIVLSDLVNELWDVQKTIESLHTACSPQTRIILNFYSRVWEWPLAAVAKMGLAKPNVQQNWLAPEDVANLLNLAGFEMMQHWQEVLWPMRTPLVDAVLNKFLVKLWPLNHLGLTNFIVARPQPVARDGAEPVVSVIVPARNEAGNVPDIMRRIPEMGGGTEIVFVEGHSKDDTYAAIEREIAAHPERRCKLLRQTGKGKGDAVRVGFAEASGDVLMILDADLTVPPEDLPRFYEALRSGRGEFINGVRLVYPMQERAMRFLNLLGNKFFSLAFTWLLGQPIKDTLCGTKVLRKRDYDRIAANRAYFGEIDPFGDFDLLFGAAKLRMKMIDLPIRYHERTYGTTNIHRWSHGWLLLRMVWKAAWRIKFV